MDHEHNGPEGVEEEIGAQPKTNRRSVRVGILAAALIGATIAVRRVPKPWQSSAGAVARSAGASLRLKVWDMRQHVVPSVRSVGTRARPMAEFVGSRIGRGQGRHESNGVAQ